MTPPSDPTRPDPGRAAGRAGGEGARRPARRSADGGGDGTGDQEPGSTVAVDPLPRGSEESAVDANGASNGRPSGAGGRSGWLASTIPGAPWTRVLFVGLVAAAVWLLLDAPSLQRSAEESPIGVRRTVSLDVVGPVAALSRGLGLSHVVGWTDELFGRTPGGGPTLAAVTAPAARHGSTEGSRSRRPGPTGVPATTTTTTFPVLDSQPTAADPLRVLIVGDSVGLDLGQALVADLSNTGVVTPDLDGRVDTGLSRPDYFDWPAELQIDITNDHPNLLVVMIGANDPQSLVGPTSSIAYGSPGWTAEYGRRVGAFIDEANQAGVHVLWVGMPPMANPLLNAELQQINGIVQSQVSARPGKATFFSSVPVLGDAHGNFTAYLTNSSGAAINVRTTDGIHLAPGGAELLSQAVIADMRAQLHIDLPH